MGLSVRECCGLDALSGADHVGVYIRQMNQAHEAFGYTVYNQPGRVDVQYARLSGQAAIDLIRYWRTEASIARSHVAEIPDSAHRSAWEQAVRFFGDRANYYEVLGKSVGTALLSDEDARDIWRMLDPVVFPMDAMLTTPTKWDIWWQAVGEAIEELPSRIVMLPSAGLTLLQIAAAAAGVGGGLWFVSHLLRRQ